MYIEKFKTSSRINLIGAKESLENGLTKLERLKLLINTNLMVHIV